MIKTVFMKNIQRIIILMSLLFAFHSGKTQCNVDSIPVMGCYDSFNNKYCYMDDFIIDGNYISSFSFYNNPDTSYQEFTTPYIMLMQNNSYFWECNGYSDDFYRIAVWVDVNANGYFEDVEMLSSEFSGSPSSYLSGAFNIPGNAVADTVKMRVMKLLYGLSVDPNEACGSTTNMYGETEDYYAIIQCGFAPTPSYTGFETTCEGQPAILYVYTDYGYINWYADTSVAPVASGDLFLPITYAGDSTFIFEVGTIGCSNQAYYTFDVHTDPTPVVIISGPDTVQSCSAESFSANPGLDNYTWNTGDNTQTITITNGFGGNLAVSSTNSFGCTGSDFIFVQIAPQSPSAYVTNYVGSQFCIDGQIVLNYDSLISPGTVDWYDSTMNYLGSGSSIAAYEPGITIHNFTVYINSVCGLDTANITVLTEALPSVDSIYSPQAMYDASGNANLCTNGDVTFIALNLSGTIDFWEITDITNGNTFQWPDNNDTITFPGWMAQPGVQFSIFAVLTNSYGCVANSPTFTGTVVDSYDLNFSDSLLLCPFPGLLGINLDYAQYDFQWSTGDTTNSISVTAEGMYTLVITDDYYGCNDMDSVYVMDGNVTFDPFADTTLVCADDITFFAGTGFAYYYWEQWDEFGNLINTSNGDNFYVSMNSIIYVEADTYGGGCIFFDTTYVMIAGPFSFSLGNDVNSSASSFFINGPGGMSSYLWNTGATTENLTVTTSGTYYLTAINSFGCEYTDTIVVNFLNGITEWNNDYLFSIYPNPSDEYVFIETAGEKITQIEIYSVNGSLIESISVTTEIKTKLDIASLENGTYLLKVITENSSGWGKMAVTK